MTSAPALSRTAFLIVFAVSFATQAGNLGLQSVLPPIGRAVGIPDPLVAGIFSLSALLWTLTAPVWARRSDRVGRKPMITLGLAGFAVSMTGCACVVLAGLHHLLPAVAVFLGFAGLRAIFGAIGSAASPASQAYVADRTPAESRTEVMSQLAGATGLGAVVGPAVASLIATTPVLTLSTPMFAFALLAASLLVVVWRGVPEAKGAPLRPRGRAKVVDAPSRQEGAAGARRSVWRDPAVAPFLLFGFLAASAQTVNTYTLGFHVIDKLGTGPFGAQKQIGIALMAGAMATLLAQWGLIRLFRMGPRHLLRWGAALAAAGNVALALAPSYETVVFAYALASLGYGFARPGFTAGSSLAAGDEGQGAVAGAVTAIFGSSVIVTPVLAVTLYERSAMAVFLLNAVVLIALTVFAYANGALRRSGEAPTTDAETAQSALDSADGGATP